MHLALLLCLTGAMVWASLENREVADQAQYISAVSALVIEYFTPPYYASVTVAVASAASAASVPGDAGSLLVSCLAAPTPPGWFSTAIPPPLSTNMAALEAAVHSLSPKPTPAATPTGEGGAGGAGMGMTTGVVTTTDAAGKPVTSTFTSAVATGAGNNSSSSSNGAMPTGRPGSVVGGLVALVGVAVAL